MSNSAMTPKKIAVGMVQAIQDMSGLPFYTRPRAKPLAM